MTTVNGDSSPRLARSLALLNRAEQIGGLGSWEWTPAHGELLWSDNLFRLMGVEPGAIVPSVAFVLDRAHPDDRRRIEDAVRAIASGVVMHLEYRIVRTDGALRYLRAEVAALGDPPSSPRRIVGSVQDVTPQRLLDRQLAAHLAATQALEDWSARAGPKQLIGRLATALDVPFAAFWVPDGSTFTVRELWQLPGGLLAPVVDATREWRPGMGSPSVGRAFTGLTPVVLADASEGGSPARSAAIRAAGLRAAMAIPAVSGQKALAVLEFLSVEPVELTERLVGALNGIGHAVGQFLSRRRGELTWGVLSPRELEALQLAANGRSTAAIAAELYLSPATVKRHFERAYVRLGVSDRVAAVSEAMRRGLIA